LHKGNLNMSINDNDNSLLHKKISDIQEARLLSYLEEYVKLKDEQIARMRFRDNLLYVSLVAFGGIISYAITDQSHYYAFLILPWVCFILGWTYLVNDEKISAIGKYIREHFTKQVAKLVEIKPENIESESFFGWEIAHRGDDLRIPRKKFQRLVDEITFCGSGVIAVISFWFLAWKDIISSAPIWVSLFLSILSIFELWLLFRIDQWIIKYADFKKSSLIISSASPSS